MTRETKGFGEPGRVGLRARGETMHVEAIVAINWLLSLRHREPHREYVLSAILLELSTGYRDIKQY